MELEEINQLFEKREYSKDSALTQVRTYCIVDSKSFFADQFCNRNSAGWKKAQFIVIKDEVDVNNFEQLIENWVKFASSYHDQFLIVQKEEKGWLIYDDKGNPIGNESNIEDVLNRTGYSSILYSPLTRITNDNRFYLSIGEYSEDGSVRIVDEDKLCYRIESSNRGAFGVRTISKDLLLEWIEAIEKDSSKTATDFRELLSGKTNNDKFEYGYASTFYTLAKMHIANKEKYKKMYMTKKWSLQQIFYGAPGTGKSHKVKEVTETLPKSDVFRTTFHPDSDYSTFVGCYKPKMVKAPIRDGSGHEITSACEDEKKRIAYEYEPQAFLKAYIRAYETSEPVFLVIEEINRGNCAQIFGDMFQLLDRSENGESDYAIKPETAIQEFLYEKLSDCDIEDDAIKSGEEMRLPANLHIWATMNTSDQSLFPIDSAFKRRWDWKYMPINTRKESWSIKVNGTEYNWSNFLEKINNEIDSATHSEDKKLGFYFCKAENGVISAERFVSKVLFYLWNDVFKDYGFGKDIFNDTEGKLCFGKFYRDNGEIQEDKVELFLKNLGVDIIKANDTSIDDPLPEVNEDGNN